MEERSDSQDLSGGEEVPMSLVLPKRRRVVPEDGDGEAVIFNPGPDQSSSSSTEAFQNYPAPSQSAEPSSSTYQGQTLREFLQQQQLPVANQIGATPEEADNIAHLLKQNCARNTTQQIPATGNNNQLASSNAAAGSSRQFPLADLEQEANPRNSAAPESKRTFRVPLTISLSLGCGGHVAVRFQEASASLSPPGSRLGPPNIGASSGSCFSSPSIFVPPSTLQQQIRTSQADQRPSERPNTCPPSAVDRNENYPYNFGRVTNRHYRAAYHFPHLTVTPLSGGMPQQPPQPPSSYGWNPNAPSTLTVPAASSSLSQISCNIPANPAMRYVPAQPARPPSPVSISSFAQLRASGMMPNQSVFMGGRPMAPPMSMSANVPPFRYTSMSQAMHASGRYNFPHGMGAAQLATTRAYPGFASAVGPAVPQPQGPIPGVFPSPTNAPARCISIPNRRLAMPRNGNVLLEPAGAFSSPYSTPMPPSTSAFQRFAPAAATGNPNANYSQLSFHPGYGYAQQPRYQYQPLTSQFCPPPVPNFQAGNPELWRSFTSSILAAEAQFRSRATAGGGSVAPHNVQYVRETASVPNTGVLDHQRLLHELYEREHHVPMSAAATGLGSANMPPFPHQVGQPSSHPLPSTAAADEERNSSTPPRKAPGPAKATRGRGKAKSAKNKVFELSIGDSAGGSMTFHAASPEPSGSKRPLPVEDRVEDDEIVAGSSADASASGSPSKAGRRNYDPTRPSARATKAQGRFKYLTRTTEEGEDDDVEPVPLQSTSTRGQGPQAAPVAEYPSTSAAAAAALKQAPAVASASHPTMPAPGKGLCFENERKANQEENGSSKNRNVVSTEYDYAYSTDSDSDDEDEEKDSKVNEKLVFLMANFNEDQWDRYEVFSRSRFSRGTVKSLMMRLMADKAQVSEKALMVMAGIAKILVAEVVEEALDLRDKVGEVGALKPSFIKAAIRKLRNTTSIPNFNVRRGNPFTL